MSESCIVGLQFVRRMGLKATKPLVMVKPSAVQLYTGPSDQEAMQQGYAPAVVRDIIDTGLQARCFLMFEDGAVCALALAAPHLCSSPSLLHVPRLAARCLQPLPGH